MITVALILYLLGGVTSWAFLESEDIQDAKWWAKAGMVALWPVLTAALGAFVLLMFLRDAWGVWRYKREAAE